MTQSQLHLITSATTFMPFLICCKALYSPSPFQLYYKPPTIKLILHTHTPIIIVALPTPSNPPVSPGCCNAQASPKGQKPHRMCSRHVSGLDAHQSSTGPPGHCCCCCGCCCCCCLGAAGCCLTCHPSPPSTHLLPGPAVAEGPHLPRTHSHPSPPGQPGSLACPPCQQ